MGSGGFGFAHGSAFTGACAPNGLAKVGPDTRGPHGTINFLHYSGYWYGDDKIQGFSHLHLHGTGATDYGVLGVMPTDAFDASRTTSMGYESPFAKESETSAPGTYAVTLDRGAIRAEITATTRAAHHRWTFAAGAAEGWVVLDLDHHLNSGSVADAELALDPAAQRITGRLRSIGGMSGGFGGYDVFFAARTRQPWTAAQVWSGGAAPADGTAASGQQVGAALRFDVATGTPVELQVGLSLVSPEDAAANLEAELPGWAFEDTRAATAAAWKALLATVLVEGGTADERTTFYSSLYHAFLMPTVMSDVDGSYRYAGQILRAEGFRFVSDLSLWDTYRTLHPLYSLLAPREALDSVASLSAMALASGFFPRWPIATGEAGTMIGASAEIVLADAYVKGITAFDAESAYAILRAAAMDPTPPAGGRGGRNDVEGYLQYGFVPANAGRSVSKTTEFAHDDFGLAQLAGALGHADDAAALLERSRGYRQLFDPETGFLRGKLPDGSWAIEDFDPLEWNDDYVEANAWHSLWMAAHDLDGFAELFGGKPAMVEKLNLFFEMAQADYEATIDDEGARSLPRPYYWHGNEPDIHAAYLFAQAGRPDLTQKWVRWIMANLHGPGPDGLAGNDDGGTLGAWYVFSALGFYPLPGSDRYIVGTPLFTKARIAVAGGEFVIEAPEASARNLYVQAVTLDGVPLATPELRHADLTAGRVLRFEMGPEPGDWGQAP